MVKVKVKGKDLYLDGILKQTIDRANMYAKKDWDNVFVIDGEVGCLTGDTLINFNRATLGKRCRLDWMYNQFHNNVEKLKHFKQWDSRPTFVRSFDGNNIGLHPILDVIYSGIKEVFLLSLEGEFNIKATANHKILTQKGWKELNHLTKDDKVMVDNVVAFSKDRVRPKLPDVRIGRMYHHPFARITEWKGKKNAKVEVHRLIYEAHLNKLDFFSFLDILCNEPEEVNRLKFVDPAKYVIHHKDGNHYNNTIPNLECLTHKKHLVHHGKPNYKNFHQGEPQYKKIKTIKPIGREKTYDIICSEPHHNFVANGIVVHNSGKSVFTMQNGFYGSEGRLSLNEVCFSPKDFREAVINAKKYSHVIFDEAFRGFSGRASMSQTNRILVKMLNEIRQKNLTVWIVIPSVWDLDAYVSKHRTRGLFHIYTSREKRRGFFRFYNKTTVLYWLGNTKNKYRYPRSANFFGRFTNNYPLDESAYRRKKYAALKEGKDDDVYKSERFRDQCDATWYAMYLDMGMNFTEIASFWQNYSNYPLTYMQISRRIEAYASKKGFSTLNSELNDVSNLNSQNINPKIKNKVRLWAEKNQALQDKENGVDPSEKLSKGGKKGKDGPNKT